MQVLTNIGSPLLYPQSIRILVIRTREMGNLTFWKLRSPKPEALVQRPWVLHLRFQGWRAFAGTRPQSQKGFKRPY